MSEFFCIFASDLRKRQFESELPLTLLLLYSYLPPTTPFRGGCFVADHRSVVNMWGDVSKWFIF